METLTPTTLELEIQRHFAGAVPMNPYLRNLSADICRIMGQPKERILFGQCTCVDDIIYTKSDLETLGFLGPFNIGGLAGLPFTGLAGVKAFAGHAPKDGAIFIFCAPHIGISEDGQWGFIHRHGQDVATTCCGAAVGALGAMEQDAPPVEHRDDHQLFRLQELAYENRDELLALDKAADGPGPGGLRTEALIRFTQLLHDRSKERLVRYLKTLEPEELHTNEVFFVSGIIINTDHNHPDYFVQLERKIIDARTHTSVRV